MAVLLVFTTNKLSKKVDAGGRKGSSDNYSYDNAGNQLAVSNSTGGTVRKYDELGSAGLGAAPIKIEY